MGTSSCHTQPRYKKWCVPHHFHVSHTSVLSRYWNLHAIIYHNLAVHVAHVIHQGLRCQDIKFGHCSRARRILLPQAAEKIEVLLSLLYHEGFKNSMPRVTSSATVLREVLDAPRDSPRLQRSRSRETGFRISAQTQNSEKRAPPPQTHHLQESHATPICATDSLSPKV